MNLFKKLGLLAATTVATLMFGTMAFGFEQTGASETSVKVNFGAYSSSQKVYYELAEDSTFNWVTQRDYTYGGDKTFYSLIAGRAYYVRYSLDQRHYSEGLQVVTVPDMASTYAVSQVAAGNGTATVQWPKVPGASGYMVFVNNVQQPSTTANKVTVRVPSSTTSTLVKISPYKRSASGYIARETYNYNSVYVKALPSRPSKVKYSSTLTTSLGLDWDDASNATGYQLEYANYKGKGKTYVDTGYSSYYYFSHPKNTFYRFRVRAYVTCGNKKFYTGWSAYSYISKDLTYNDVKLKSASTRYQNRIRVSWNKMKGAKKYVVYMAQGSAAGFKKVKTTKSRSIIISKFRGRNLATHTNYYFKVVAVGKYKKKKLKSPNKAYEGGYIYRYYY